jgi:L-threonylcarbamoyladenylate synthase
MPIVPASPAMIAKAAALLRDGKLVAFPTETVYGLGGDATNDRAIANIFEAKGRPEFNPLIAHIADMHDLDALVISNETARRLVEQFWPGPLTLVLPKAKECPVSLLASAGLDTLAVRMPAHPVALDLLRAFGGPVAAPSANASGKLSPTSPQHVAESLNDKVDLILDGGQTIVGVESTVLDLTSPKATILRPGGVTQEQLESILGPVRLSVHDETAPKSPGMLSSHYAPHLPLRLNASSAADDEALLCFGPDTHVKGGAMRLNLSAKGDLKEAAANLFSMLRQLDQPPVHRSIFVHRSIAVMPIPRTGLGMAINDRLQRAAAPRILD